jgi:hypothetical protein
MKNIKLVLGVAVCLAVAGVAYATVTIDLESGIGFVGKGDVQTIFGWNNSQLQANADSVQFRVEKVVVTQQSWECANVNNEAIQVRALTATTTIGGMVSSVGRKMNQITGFNLLGWDENGKTETTYTAGNTLNSCPDDNPNKAEPKWFLSVPAGDPEVIAVGGNGLQVSINGTDWFSLE